MKTTGSPHFMGAMNRFCDLVEDGGKLGMEVLDCLREFRPLILFPPLGLFRHHFPRTRGCSCDIPAPCWMPRPIGAVISHVCPGGTATVRLRIGNCGATTRHFKIEVAGGSATVTPASLTLESMERGFAVASITMPTDASYGEEQEKLVWVRGCNDHFLRWTVLVSRRGSCVCPEVYVEDCPDLIHHWYDHFYCNRPCVHRS